MGQLRLSAIYVYPIKSLAGIPLSKAHVMEKGLTYDRRWMLVDHAGQMITIRDHHPLALVQPEINHDVLLVRMKGHPPLPLSLKNIEGPEVQAKVWKDTCSAIEVSKEANAWFTTVTGIPCKLVWMPEESLRPIKKKWAIKDEQVSFADGYPYLVAGKQSLEDLTQKIGSTLTMRRFRPNLVFEGGKPYEEFLWRKFKIGQNLFYGLKPCERCVVTTIDPDTAEQGKEPLLTLSGQKIENKVVFGQHAVATDHGEIKVGDPIEVLEQKETPYQEYERTIHG